MLMRIADYCREHGLLPAGVPLLTGFSGGADSTALVLILRELGIAQTAVHMHHGLRDEAEADAAWCAAFCAARGIDFRLVRLDVPVHQAPGESIEMAARRLRLAAWRQLVSDRPGARVALGHHQDDQIETLLMRLMRGANSSGLTGLRPLRMVEGVTLIRPLLAATRAEIEAYLAAAGVADWRQDASNDSAAHLRNRVRHELIPLIADLGGRNGLARTATLLAVDAAALEVAPAAVAGLTGQHLAMAGEAERLRLLRAWAVEAGHGALVLNAGAARKLHLVLAAGVNREAKAVEIGDGRWLQLSTDAVAISAAPRSALTPFDALEWHWRQEPVLKLPDGRKLLAELGPAPAELESSNGGVAWFDAAGLPPTLFVRSRLPGDRMQPFGAAGPVRLKKLIGGSAASARQRDNPVVVLTPAGEILWLAPLRRSGLLPAEPGKEALCLSLS